jgi:hypothetical protein
MDETIEHREKEKKRGKIEIRHLQQGNRSSWMKQRTRYFGDTKKYISSVER